MLINLKFGATKDESSFEIEIDRENLNGNDLKEFLKLNYDTFNSFQLVSSSGISVKPNREIFNGDTFYIYPNVLGGKGGFGSLLRAFGKQITKSTNREACRDLTGRRIRTVNREKRRKEFLEQQTERAKQREQEKLEKKEKRKKESEKKHIFEDKKYDQQKEKIAQDLEQALNENKKRKLETEATTSTETAATVATLDSSAAPVITKSTASTIEQPKKQQSIMKKLDDWIGVELSDEDDDDDEVNEKDVAQKKKLKT